MASIEDFGKSLGKLLSDITNSGFGNISPAQCEQLGTLAADADSLGLGTGKKLINNLAEIIKSFQAGKSEEKSVSIRFTALDFYQKNIADGQGEAEIEDI
jgi:hypothetical protein